MAKEKKTGEQLPVSLKDVESKIAVIRNREVIADADVAFLFGVQTKRVNEAVSNNRGKFPESYMFELTESEVIDLRSKITTTKVSSKSRSATKVFTEKGLYMIATVLNGDRAREATLLIIETFAKVRTADFHADVFGPKCRFRSSHRHQTIWAANKKEYPDRRQYLVELKCLIIGHCWR